MPRVLLLLPTTTYRAHDFLDAAARLHLDVTVGTEETSALEGVNPQGLLTLDFRDPAACARRVEEFARDVPVDAVVGVDEETAVAAAAISARLGRPSNPPGAAVAAWHKGTLRRRLAAHGVSQPAFRLFSRDESAARRGRRRPVSVRAQADIPRRQPGRHPRGRPEEFSPPGCGSAGSWTCRTSRAAAASSRARSWSRSSCRAARSRSRGFSIGGRSHVLALFDKPDPLDGPFFEETIYVTPSRLPAAAQAAIRDRVAEARGPSGSPKGRCTPSCGWAPSGPRRDRDRRALDRRPLLADAALRHGDVARGDHAAQRAAAAGRDARAREGRRGRHDDPDPARGRPRASPGSIGAGVPGIVDVVDLGASRASASCRCPRARAISASSSAARRRRRRPRRRCARRTGASSFGSPEAGYLAGE